MFYPPPASPTLSNASPADHKQQSLHQLSRVLIGCRLPSAQLISFSSTTSTTYGISGPVRHLLLVTTRLQTIPFQLVHQESIFIPSVRNVFFLLPLPTFLVRYARIVSSFFSFHFVLSSFVRRAVWEIQPNKRWNRRLFVCSELTYRCFQEGGRLLLSDD